MKKSRKFATLMAVVLVLVLSISTFVACSGKAKEITPDLFKNSLVNGINAMFPANGYYFGIDAAASCTVENGADSARYDVVIQGTLDTDPKTTSADNQLKIELKETKGGATKTLFGLFYKDKLDQGAAEYEANAPKLFLNINDEHKFAYNTYSIKKLVKDLDKSSETSDMVSIAGFELSADNIVTALLTFLADPDTYKQKTVKKEVFMSVELNVNKLFQNILVPLITENSEAIDGVLGAIDTNLNAALIAGLDVDIPMLLTTKYTKVKKKETPKFLGATLDIDFNKNRPIQISVLGKTIVDTNIPQSKVKVDLGKINILSGQKVDIEMPTTGYTLINPINISLDGKLKISNSKDSDVTNYNVILRVDANPIPIAYGFDGWNTKEAVFKSLGMVHFSIVSADGKKALIDLVYDPKHTGSDSVYASLGLGMANINTQFSLSSLEGLIDSISKYVSNSHDIYGNKVEKPVTPNTLTNQANGDVDNWLETLKPFVADLLTGGLEGLLETFKVTLTPEVKATLVKVNTMVQGMIDSGEVKLGTIARPTQNNLFLEVDLDKVISTVLDSEFINIPENIVKIINSVKGIISNLFGGHIINLEFESLSYGTTPHDYNATRYFDANMRSDASFIKSFEGFNNPTFANKIKDGITATEFMNTVKAGTTIPMKYIDYKNGKQMKSFKPMIVTGFDKTKTGVQSVTIGFMDPVSYEAINVIMSALGSAIPGADKIPFGLIRYTFDVNFK